MYHFNTELKQTNIPKKVFFEHQNKTTMTSFSNILISFNINHQYTSLGILVLLLPLLCLFYINYYLQKGRGKRKTKRNVNNKESKIIYNDFKHIYQTTDILLQDRNNKFDENLPFYPAKNDASFLTKILVFIIAFAILFIPLYDILHIPPIDYFYYYQHSCF